MSFAPGEIAYQEAHIHQDKATEVIVVVSVFGAIALACLIARVIVRFRGDGLKLDDYLMIVGALFTFVQVLSVYELCHLGFGHHLLALKPENIVPLGKWTVVSYFSFPPSIAFVKWSILAQIARIFTLRDPIMRFGVWFLSIYTFFWLLGLLLATGLVCRPFDSYWNATIPCIVPFSVTEVPSILDIISDFAIVMLPQRHIWRLQMSVRNKIAVSFVLGLGLFCTATGIVRIVVTEGTDPQDGTYQPIPLIFACLEPIIAVIAGCLPALQKNIMHNISLLGQGIVRLSRTSLSHLSSSVRSARGSSRSSNEEKTEASKTVNTFNAQAKNLGGSRPNYPGAVDIESLSHGGEAKDLTNIQRTTEISVTSESGQPETQQLNSVRATPFA